MKRIVITACSATLLWVSPGLAGGPECANAAVSYLHASRILELHDGEGQFKNLDWSSLPGAEDWGNLPPELRAAFEAIPDQMVYHVLTAANLECCDFQVARELGPYVLLPHLGGVRNVARVVRLDARGRLADGNAEEAAERIAALYRMARGVSQDQLMISTLVGVAIASLAHKEVEVMLASGRLTPAARQVLREAVAKLGDDPFGFEATLRGERDWLLDWVRREFRGPDAGPRLARVASEFSGGETHPAFILTIRTLDEGQIAEHADRLETYYEHIIEAWGEPDARERLKELEARLNRGEFGVLVPFAAAFERVYDSCERSRQERTRIAEALASAPAR